MKIILVCVLACGCDPSLRGVEVTEPALTEVECQNQLFNDWHNSRPVIGLGGESGHTINDAVGGLMTKYQLPGAAVAVSRNGALAFTKSYGIANSRDNTASNDFPLGPNSQVVEPDDLFRLASVSKPLTAAEILAMITNKVPGLSLNTFAITLLAQDGITPLGGLYKDPRVFNITVRQLLLHTSGFDGDFDPTDYAQVVAQAAGVASPPTCRTNIEYVLANKDLIDSPGGSYSYANFNYCVLAYVIAHYSSLSYADSVMRDVLLPVNSARAETGDSMTLLPAEVYQMDYYGAPLGQSVFDSNPGAVYRPWGTWSVEATAGSGSWLNSATGEMRFLTGIDGTGPTQVIDASARNEMTKYVSGVTPCNSSSGGSCTDWVGLGWNHVTSSGKWWKIGTGYGATAELRHLSGGKNWVALFNSHPNSDVYPDFDDDIRATLDSAIENATFDGHDFFDQYTPALTSWMGNNDFQNYFNDQKNNHGRYPSRLEGRWSGGQAHFRARFATWPSGSYFTTSWGKSCNEINSIAASVGSGYKIVNLQSYRDGGGLMRFQVTWVNL